ncbi:MAG TPA: hypothetical protein VFU65_13515 [Actinocrinis sp.]|nr:hypothetical protein [Actinocrinis sp.]
MTHIALFDERLSPSPLGTAAKRTHGPLSRMVHASASVLAARRVSAFELGFRSTSAPAPTPTSHAAAAPPWTLSAIGVGMGLAASVAFASGLVSATSAAAAVLLRDSRRGKVHVSPAALHLHSTPARPPEAAEPVSVLIAMRHKPDPAVAAVRAALCQRGVDHLDLVVLDDGCPQETRAVLSQEFGDDPRVRILAAAPLPRGWSPHAHRFHQLAVAARGRVLIFAEPCAPLGPHAAASATALLRGEQLDLAVLDTGRPAPTPASSQTADSADGSATAPTRAPEPQPTIQHAHDSAERRGGAAKGDGSSTRPATQHRHLPHHRSLRSHGSAGRTHPGRFTVAVDADAYWRIGGYRAAATDPDPLALLRTVRRASGRVAVADGRRVIPPAQLLDPLPAPDPGAEALWESQHSSRASITGTARRVLAALVGARS